MCYNLLQKFETGDNMSKINIHTVLKTQEKTYEYDVPAIFREDDEILIYKEQDEQRTTTSFNYRTKELIRENDSLKMNYIFNKEKNARGTIFIKELGRTFDLIIKTRKILRCEQNIEIDFFVEEQPFKYKIEVK